jgi:hypothetical protein
MNFKVSSVALLLLISIEVFGQFDIIPDGTFSTCPDQWIVYSINNQFTTTCVFDVDCTNCEFRNGNTQTSITTAGAFLVDIKWHNTTNLGSLRVTRRNCGNDQSTWVKSVTIPILSINGVNPGTITNDSGGTPTTNLTVNTNNSVTYGIPQINFPNIGPGDNNPKQVHSYEWQIPAGWSVVGGGTSKTITVQPDNCTGGTMRVRGVNNCPNGPYFSNWSNALTITRNLATPGVISGPDLVVCTNTTPVQFTVPAVTGATSYVWTKPSGWSGTSTTNSITLTPSGTNGGNVTVKAEGCNLQSTAAVKPVSLELFNPSTPPTITGPSVIPCTGATFTLSNVPAGATVTWLASPGYFYSNSGSGTSASLTPYDLSSGGPGTVTFTVSTACGNFQKQSNEFSVQGLLPSAIYFTNSENEGMYFCSSSYGNYFEIVSGASGTSYEARLLDITGQTVLYTSNVTNYQAGTNLWDYYPSSNGYYVFEVRGTNECGSTDWFGTEVEYVNCTWLFTVYPNPAENYLEVEILNESKQKSTERQSYEMILTDTNGEVKLKASSKAKSKRIDISSLKNGRYILRVISNGEVEERQIIISR